MTSLRPAAAAVRRLVFVADVLGFATQKYREDRDGAAYLAILAAVKPYTADQLAVDALARLADAGACDYRTRKAVERIGRQLHEVLGRRVNPRWPIPLYADARAALVAALTVGDAEPIFQVAVEDTADCDSVLELLQKVLAS